MIFIKLALGNLNMRFVLMKAMLKVLRVHSDSMIIDDIIIMVEAVTGPIIEVLLKLGILLLHFLLSFSEVSLLGILVEVLLCCFILVEEHIIFSRLVLTIEFAAVVAQRRKTTAIEIIIKSAIDEDLSIMQAENLVIIPLRPVLVVILII